MKISLEENRGAITVFSKAKCFFIPLSAIEFRLVKIFLNNPDQEFRYEQLIKYISPKANFKTVQIYINKIRNKIGRVTTDNQFVENIPGVGYIYRTRET